MHSGVDNGCSVVEKPYLRSGELASLSGISADTLRHYEPMKLLATPRRSSGNYRLYPSEALDRVRLIQRALAVGFSLSELSEILAVRDGGGSPCRKVKWERQATNGYDRCGYGPLRLRCRRKYPCPGRDHAKCLSLCWRAVRSKLGPLLFASPICEHRHRALLERGPL